MILFFSATGNSRYCARMLAQLLDDEATDVLPFLRGEAQASFDSHKPWVFVCPVYSWQAPRVFLQFLQDTAFTGSTDAYFVLTCGEEIGNAAAALQTLCSAKRWTLRGVMPVVMPNNYILFSRAPQQPQALQIIDAARASIQEAAARILSHQGFPMQKATFLDRLKSGPINNGFYLMTRKNGFSATSLCTGCGLCSRVCPLCNIHMHDSRPVWGNHCTQCTACINRCPVQAIEYGRLTRGKTRYVCPL